MLVEGYVNTYVFIDCCLNCFHYLQKHLIVVIRRPHWDLFQCDVTSYSLSVIYINSALASSYPISPVQAKFNANQLWNFVKYNKKKVVIHKVLTQRTNLVKIYNFVNGSPLSRICAKIVTGVNSRIFELGRRRY